MWDTTRRLQLPKGVNLSREHVCIGPATIAERRAMQYPEILDPKARSPRSPEFKGSGGFWEVDVSKPCPTNGFEILAEEQQAPAQMCFQEEIPEETPLLTSTD